MCSARNGGVSVVNAHTDPLLRKINTAKLFSEDELECFRKLPIQIVQLRPGQHIVREGDRPTRSCLVIEGFVCASKTTGDGDRQIASFYIPGDIPDLQSLHLGVMDISFEAITPCTVGFIPHEALHRLCEDYPRLGAALWRTTLVDAAIYREWVANVGQRHADSRLAHLLCEILMRMSAVGLAEDNSCELPMTQTELGDALGISVVHVNRTLQKLRRDGLISFKSKRLKVLDWKRLSEIGDFDPTYLHLTPPPPA